MPLVLRRVTTLILAVGGSLAALLLLWTASRAEYTHHEIEKGTLAIALLTLTAAYAAKHRRSPLHWLGVPAYLLSCLAVALTLPAWINGVFKGFAPASPDEASLAFWHGIANLALVAGLSAVAWYAVARMSKVSSGVNDQ